MKSAWLLTYGATELSITAPVLLDGGLDAVECYTTTNNLLKYTLVRLGTQVRQSTVEKFLADIRVETQFMKGYERGIDSGESVVVRHPGFRMLVKHKAEGHSSFESWTKKANPWRGGLLALKNKKAEHPKQLVQMKRELDALTARVEETAKQSYSSKDVFRLKVRVMELEEENRELKEGLKPKVSPYDEFMHDELYHVDATMYGRRISKGDFHKAVVKAVEKRIGKSLTVYSGAYVGSGVKAEDKWKVADMKLSLSLLPDEEEMKDRARRASVMVEAPKQAAEVETPVEPEEEPAREPWLVRMYGIRL